MVHNTRYTKHANDTLFMVFIQYFSNVLDHVVCRDAAFGIQQDSEGILKTMTDNEDILDELEDKIRQSTDIANNVKNNVKQVSLRSERTTTETTSRLALK